MLESLPILPSFLALLTPLRACFPRQATFHNFVAICFGWTLALGRGRLSDALVAGGLVDSKHWSAFYRFFSRSTWSLDRLGLAVAGMALDRCVPDGVVTIAVDDTLHAKGGKNVFGAGMHRDPLASTRRRARFQFGHCWVVLAIVVKLPFARRPRALPVLFRLNVPPKMALRWGIEHRKKTEQAADLVELLAAAFPGRQLRVVADDAYSCKTVLLRLPDTVQMTGRLRLDAELYSAPEPWVPGSRGRPRKWGRRLSKPLAIATAPSSWTIVSADIYGRVVEVRLKHLHAFWMSAGHDRPLHIVIVWRPTGQYPYEAFFCTEPGIEASEILESYAQRWPIEVAFHETKASLGVEHPQPTTSKAVQRTAPTAMLFYSLIVLWYAEHGHGSAAATWKRRPWYRHKTCTSFADMLTTLRRATLDPDLFQKTDSDRSSAKVRAALEGWFRQAA